MIRRTPRASALPELARLFLKLGTTAFGGPAAHVAMMEDEVVRRRRWLSREQFLDYIGATNLIPGPNSTELALHIGHARGGWPGLLVAGSAFIVPATLIVTAAAWAYVRFGALPRVAGLLYGVKPVVIAIVVQALWKLGRVAIKSPASALLTAVSIVAVVLGVHELIVLASAGGIMAAAAIASTETPPRSLLIAPVAASAGGIGVGIVGAAAAPFSLVSLFLVFAKAGAVLFGSGYVLLAFLRADLVERLGWLTEPQLLDAIAIGQVTPGPVFTTATFIGYLLGGSTGAVVATVGIFLPAFVFVAVSGPLVPRLRRSPLAGAVLDGVNAASLALMATVSWELGRSAIVDPITVGLAAASLIAIARFRVNSVWLIAAGGALGWLLH